MKKTIIYGLCALVIGTSTSAAAMPIAGNLVTQQQRYYSMQQEIKHSKARARRAETVAAVALLTAGFALILSIKASENNPGHVQIARF